MTDKTDIPAQENDSAIEPEVVVETGLEEKNLSPKVYSMPPPREQRRKDYSNQVYVKDPEIMGAVERLARLGLSKSAVSIACRITPAQLTAHYLEEYGKGQAGMQEVVARGLMDQAMAGNPQVLMYLGKSKLGWTEANVVEHVGEIRAVVSAKPLSREEFEQRYLKKDDDGEL